MTVLQYEEVEQDKLSLTTKLGFGIGGAGSGIVANLIGWFITAFLLDVAGIRPAMVGLIFAISLVWDGLTDPIVGALSDRTKTRWGRKRPWLLFGALPFGVTYVLLWLVPDISISARFWYYLLMAILLKTMFTVVSVPYTALTPELTKDFDERTKLNFYRFGSTLIGSLIAVFGHQFIVEQGSSPEQGHLNSAIIWGVVVTVVTWITFWTTHEDKRPPLTEEEQSTLWQDLKMMFHNKPFLIVTGVYFLSWLTLQFIQINLLLYLRYWMNAESQFPIIVFILQVTAVLFLGVWTWVSSKIGKKNTYIIGAIIWLVALGILFSAQPGQIFVIYWVAFLGGTGVAIAFLIPWSMIPDVVDYSELHYGQRREGTFYGMYVFLQKLGLAGVMVISNAVLDLAGYIQISGDEFATQPDNVVMTLRAFVSLVPAAILVLSIPLVIAYPITKEYFEEIQIKLAKQRKRG